jgi:serine/threonine protein kinase
MECNLREYLLENGGLISEEEQQRMLRCIAEAIKSLHDLGISHGDVKMENILRDKSGNWFLADLGLARVGRSSVQCGSKPYVAPEMVLNQEHGPEVDVWSLGVLLLSLHLQAFPFATFAEVLSKPVFYPKQMTVKERFLVGRMLRRNPHHRITLRELLTEIQ